MHNRVYDLEERLVQYTCGMIDVVEELPSTRTGDYISAQLIRTCHSPAFNYGEAQGAESLKDFIHKIGIILKELKECRVALKIPAQVSYLSHNKARCHLFGNRTTHSHLCEKHPYSQTKLD